MTEKGTVLVKATELPDLNAWTPAKSNQNMVNWFDPDQLSFFEKLRKIMPEEKALAVTFNLKWKVMLDEIKLAYGKQLFEMSKQQAALTGKCWFVLRIERKDWLQMPQQPLTLKLGLDPYGWGAEQEKRTLDRLDLFDPSTHYMVAADFVDVEEDLIPMTASGFCDPTSEPNLPSHAWKFKVFIVSVEWMISFRRWECSVCRKTVAQEKLKKCSKCREQRYCSKECQIHIWPHHKQTCGLLAKLHATRPTSK